MRVQQRYNKDTTDNKCERREAVRLTHADARNIPKVRNKTPLVGGKVESQDVVVDLVGVLIESAKGVNLIVAAVCDRRIDKARRAITQSTSHSRPVAIRDAQLLQGRIRHDVSVVRRYGIRCSAAVGNGTRRNNELVSGRDRGAGM